LLVNSGVSAAPDSDTQLLADSRAGLGGFATFYRRHQRAVLAFHAQRVGDPELAADLAMETFAAALEAAHDQARELPPVPVAWLFTIARRKLIDSYRRGRVEAVARRRLALEPVALEDADIERVIEIASTTDVATELAQHLPPEQVEALKARVLDERGYREIAGELRCSEAVVRMRVGRALKHLRAEMETQHD
jgi:RNA polymerase sigma-70 factor (ECF subfamily)